MLTLEQIKALLAEGLHVYRGTPGTPSYRVVWSDSIGPADGQVQMYHAHPSDEAGQDWKNVDAPDFNPADYRLHTNNTSYGGFFHCCNCLDEETPTHTKVVKFNNPCTPVEGSRVFPHYVVFTSPLIDTDELACETAIDLILALNTGYFNGDNAHPVLVI